MDFLTGSDINEDINRQLASIPNQAPTNEQPVMAPPPPSSQQYYAPQPIMMAPPQHQYGGYAAPAPQQPAGYPYGQQMAPQQQQVQQELQYGRLQPQIQQVPPQYGAPMTPQQQVPPQYGGPQQYQQQPQMQQQYGGYPAGYSQQEQVEQPVSNGARLSSQEVDDDDDTMRTEKLEIQVPGGRADVERYTARFEHERKLGMLLERRQEWTPGAKRAITTISGAADPKNSENNVEETVVTMVIDGGAAQSKGIAVGSRLVQINEVDARRMSYADNLELVKTLPRPLILVFERSRASCDTAKGLCLLRKSAGSAPPSSIQGWRQSYFVVGGAVAKKNVLQFYDNKAVYEDIVVKMFQNYPAAGLKYKAYSLNPTFKCSPIQSKSYKSAGGNITLKYFTLKNPYSKTKTIKIAAENPSVLLALHSHIMRFASKGS